jgi:hypothetical protein
MYGVQYMHAYLQVLIRRYLPLSGAPDEAPDHHGQVYLHSGLGHP